MADKLRGRIADLNATIAAKEIEFEETEKAYMALAEANQKFAENSSKFREMYKNFENLEKAKSRYQQDLDELRINMREIEGNFCLLVLCHPFQTHSSSQGQKWNFKVASTILMSTSNRRRKNAKNRQIESPILKTTLQLPADSMTT
jgi:hypothetical protein